MHKIIFGHIIAVFLVISILVFQPSVDGLLINTVTSFITLELGLMGINSKNGVIRLSTAGAWFYFYPITFYQLFSIASVSWSGNQIWTAGDLPSFLTYLASLLFALAAATVSLKSLMKVLKLGIYTELAIMAMATLYAGFAIHFMRTANAGWMDFIASPLNFVQIVWANMATIDLTFLLGFSAIQMILALLLGD